MKGVMDNVEGQIYLWMDHHQRKRKKIKRLDEIILITSTHTLIRLYRMKRQKKIIYWIP